MNPFGELHVLELKSDHPRKRGQEHGQRLKTGVQRMAELRMLFMLNETDFKTEGAVIDLARQHLPVLKAFDEELYEELVGIAEGANISPEQVVVLNHYTDLRDIHHSNHIKNDGGCSAIYVPAPHGRILGQTWDVHASAMEHVVILKFKDTLVFSVAGCLGMTGMNMHGVGVTINNLISLDAHVGVVWPAIVRKILKTNSAHSGRDVVMHALLGSGHHYVIADTKQLFAIETSGRKKKIIQSDARLPHIHTNHCLDPEMRLTHEVKKTSTTFERFTGLKTILSDTKLETTDDVYEALGRVSVPASSKDPHLTATCGAMVMDLTNKNALACKGSPSVKLFSNSPLFLDMNS